MIEVGQKAPDFTTTDQYGKTVSLKELKGQKIVLYFYPKDNTPGCTQEACNLRDNYELLRSRGYLILGVSPDSQDSHAKFTAKQELPFQLLSDPDKKIMNDYGVWGEKKMMGRTYMGVIRTTFIINEEGLVEEVISKVKTGDHANQIIENK